MSDEKKNGWCTHNICAVNFDYIDFDIFYSFAV